MSEMDFINRKKETEKIVSCINGQKNGNRILILVGTTGVGKSGLVKMILETKIKDRLSIHVDVYNSSPEALDNLHYLNELYKEIAKNTVKAKRTGHQHSGGISSPLIYSLTNIRNLLRFGVEVAWAKTIGPDTRLFEPPDDGSVLRKKNYIIRLLKEKNYIINIDNIQNIDAQSFEVLKDIMQQIDHTTLILEFTIDTSHDYEAFYSFFNALESFNAEVFPFRIEKLTFSEAKKLAPQNVDEACLRSIYETGKGNLVQMRLSAAMHEQDMEPIHYQLSALSKNELFILYLVLINGGKIEQALLFQIILKGNPVPPFSEQMIKQTLNELHQKNIIVFDQPAEVRIMHDAILSSLESQAVNPMQFTAYYALKNYYMELVVKNPDEDSLEHLLSMLMKFSDGDILGIFPYVLELIKSYKYKQSAIAKLVRLRESLSRNSYINQHILYELSLSLATFCMELGYANEAQKSLDLIYNEENAYHRALQAAILMLDFVNSDSVRKAEEMIKKATTPKEELTIQLFVLAGKMALFSSEACLGIVAKMLDTPHYKGLFEYAFLLRDYAELATDEVESIRAYKHAARIFRQFGREDLNDQLLVALSMFLAYKGELERAMNLLEKAERGKSVPKRYIINNRAVLDILAGKANEKTAASLNDALLITGDPYEILIVRCNLLICYTLLGDAKHASLVRESISEHEYSVFQYEEFRHIIYQNLYYYHYTYGSNSEANKYRNRLEDLVKELSPNSFTYRIATLQLAGVHSENEFYSNFPFRVDFLGNWDLEISKDLERCQ